MSWDMVNLCKGMLKMSSILYTNLTELLLLGLVIIEIDLVNMYTNIGYSYSGPPGLFLGLWIMQSRSILVPVYMDAVSCCVHL